MRTAGVCVVGGWRMYVKWMDFRESSVEMWWRARCSCGERSVGELGLVMEVVARFGLVQVLVVLVDEERELVGREMRSLAMRRRLLHVIVGYGDLGKEDVHEVRKVGMTAWF